MMFPLLISLGLAQPEPALEVGDCNRCHVSTKLSKIGREDSCTDCHVWILSVSSSPSKRAKAIEIFPYWERYEKNVR